jgi:peptidoglycan/LPS O-acetylase OafA/YrhL
MINRRSDIDGLRAVAIIGVLLHHAGTWRITGGFVVSEYIIITSLFARNAENDFSVGNFFLRRVKRLIPTYLLTSNVLNYLVNANINKPGG